MDLFDLQDESLKEFLRGRGWRQCAAGRRGQLVWRDPRTGRIVSEDEALRLAASLSREEAVKADLAHPRRTHASES